MSLQSTLKKLIEFKTISDDREANARALSWYAQQLAGLPLTIRNYRLKGYPSLTITTKRTKSPKVFLVAHMDVVPGSKTAFTPRVVGNTLYGRGAYDMKFAAAVYLELLLDLGADVRHLDFGVMLTTDEEIGGGNGVRPLLRKEGYRCSVAFLPDGGEDWCFERGAKGVLRLNVQSRGEAAHGARPWLGYDANKDLVQYLAALTKRFTKLAKEDVDEQPYPTAVVTSIRGGETENQVAAFAEATIDVRFPPSFSIARIRKLIKEAKQPGSRIVIRELRHTGVYINDTNERYHRAFKEIVKNIRRKTPKTVFSHGSSDARHFKDLKIPVILIRPKGGGQHSEKEWIDMRDLQAYSRCVHEFVKQVARR